MKVVMAGNYIKIRPRVDQDNFSKKTSDAFERPLGKNFRGLALIHQDGHAGEVAYRLRE